MTILNDMVPLAGPLGFYWFNLSDGEYAFDWEKITKNVIVNTGKLRLFLLLLVLPLVF